MVRTIRATAAATLFLTSVIAPAPLLAQGGAVPSHRASATVSAGVGGTRILNATRAATEASLTVSVSPGTSVGLVGWSLLRPVPLDGGTDSDLELRAAYGGVVVRRHLTGGAPVAVGAAFTAGAGNAKVRLSVVDTEAAADNFAVLEPALSVRRTLGLGFAAEGWLRYRFVLGVEDLPGITASDLRGPSAALRLTFRIGAPTRPGTR